jgi:hypothetical protein
MASARYWFTRSPSPGPDPSASLAATAVTPSKKPDEIAGTLDLLKWAGAATPIPATPALSALRGKFDAEEVLTPLLPAEMASEETAHQYADLRVPGVPEAPEGPGTAGKGWERTAGERLAGSPMLLESQEESGGGTTSGAGAKAGTCCSHQEPHMD